MAVDAVQSETPLNGFSLFNRGKNREFLLFGSQTHSFDGRFLMFFGELQAISLNLEQGNRKAY